MNKVESFSLDHKKVADVVPYVRQCKLDARIPSCIRKYDFRICKPNQEYWDLVYLHTFEHMFTSIMRDQYKDAIVDISPMGCGTGFYITTCSSEPDLLVLADAISRVISVVKEILSLYCSDQETLDEGYHFNATDCGNYKLHDYTFLHAKLKDFDESLIVPNTKTLFNNKSQYYN